jgi:membrane-bound serine protease (ClpP class)
MDNKPSPKRTVKDWLKLLVLLLDEAAAIIIVFLLLQFFEIDLPLGIIIVVALVGGGLIFIVHRAVIPSFHKRQVTGREGMIGLEGTVIDPLTPSGAVMLKGECWKARSSEGDIEVDEEVEVISIDRLTLRVRRKNQS